MGLLGGLKSFFGGKTTTQTQALDPRSQAYVEAMRRQAQGAGDVALAGPAGGGSWFTGPQTLSVGDQAAAFFNPYMSNVVDATRGEYDRLRAGALNRTTQQATLGGAAGGSRAAIVAGARLGELDQGQASTIAGLLQGGYNSALSMGIPYAEQQRQLREQQLQEPLFRQQAAQQFTQGGIGPVGYTQTQSSSGGGFGDLLKGAAGLGSLYLGAGGRLPFGLGGGPQAPPSSFGMPPQWQPPQWNPQYRGLFN